MEEGQENKHSLKKQNKTQKQHKPTSEAGETPHYIFAPFDFHRLGQSHQIGTQCKTQCQPVAKSGHTNLEVSFKDFILHL